MSVPILSVAAAASLAPEMRAIVTRQEALASGAKTYFTGKPCKRGHLSERYAEGRDCIMCGNVRWTARYAVDSIRFEYLEKRRPQSRSYYSENKETLAPQARQYYQENREIILLKKCEYGMLPHVKERRRIERATPMGTINGRMSAGLKKSLGSTKAGRKWESFVDYTAEELVVHIERQFMRGMTWENRGKWHIDHIVPLASFTFTSTDDPEFKAAWALTNLRPLWAAKNISKGAKREFLL